MEPIKQQRRQDYLEWLYLRSNRSDGLYTGLFKKRLEELVQKDMDESLGPLGDWQ